MENRSSEGDRPVLAVSALLVLTLAWSVAAAAQAPDRARTEALAKRAGERLVALQREADRLASEETTLLNGLRKLEVDRQIKAEELKRADADLAGIQADIESATRQIDTLEA